MKRWVRLTGFGVVGLGLCGVAAVIVAAHLGDRKAERQVPVAVAPIEIASSAQGIGRGRYLFMSRGCVECHGADGAGKDVVNDGKGMLVHAPNITPGPGHAVSAYRTADWVRTIRHGVKPNGAPVRVMPSEDYARLTDADLGALIGFVRQLPTRPGGGATVQLPVVVKALYGLGLIRDAAEKIDHRQPPPAPVAETVSVEHGAYVANACIGCHGADLTGGKIPGAPPDWPPAANLTPAPGSAMAHYPDAQSFAAMLRSGRRPDGSAVSPVMPFTSLRELNDTDVQAIYLHLKRLAPAARRDGG